jgi:hypothetical protein
MSLKIKTAIDEFLRERRVLSINAFESYLLKKFILTENFQSYCENDVCIESQFRSIIVCIFCWLITLRWFLAVFITNPKIWILIADPFYVTGDRILFNSLLFCISLMGSYFRTLFILGLLKIFIN